MHSSIEQSDYFFLIGTPRYRQRALLKKSNVAFEYQAIAEKIARSEPQKRDKMLVPLLYKGTRLGSFPDNVSDTLIRFFNEPQDYEHQFLSLSDPLGLLPHLYPELGKTGALYTEYKALVDHFENRLNLLSKTRKLVEAGASSTTPKSRLLRALSAGKAASWRLPKIEQPLIPRTALLKKLGPIHESQGSSAITVCTGIAGVGKTTLALQQAHNEPQYSIRVWLRAAQAETLATDYLAFAKDLGYGGADLNEAKSHVNALLEQYPGWLLVFDNASHPESIESYLPPETGSVILTTRYRPWSGVFKRVEVEVLEPMEAIALLQSLSSATYQSEDFERLAKRLGYLPLALKQAAVFMARTGIGPAYYLELYEKQEQRSVLLSEKGVDASSVAGTWNITLEHFMKAKDGTGIYVGLLLKMAAYLDADHIPHSALMKTLAVMGKQRSLLPFKPRVLEEATVLSLLAQMNDYSLIKSDATYISMHPLLQDVIRAQHPLTQAQYVQLCEVFNELWVQEDFGGEHRLALLSHLLRLKEHYHAYRSPHQKTTLVYAKVLSNMGWTCQYQLAKALLAKTLFTEVLAIQDRAKGCKPSEVARTLRYLASSELSLNQIAEAKKHLGFALQIQREQQKPEDPEVIETLMGLGRVYGAMGDFLKQKALLIQAQAIYKNKPEPHAQTARARILIDLATVHDLLGEKASARALFQEALDIYQQHYGKDHPLVGVALRHLANAYGASGQWIKKLSLLAKALGIQERHHGLQHPEVARILVDLGNVLGIAGDAKEAKDLLERALSIQEAYYGVKHWELAWTLANLGNAQSMLGDFEQAKLHLERALSIQQEHFSQIPYPDVVFSLVTLANVEGALGNPQAKKSLLRYALGIQKRHRGSQDLEVGMMHMNLGLVCQSLKEIAESREHFKGAYQIFLVKYGAAHSYTQRALKAADEMVAD